jgi:AraC-like DNA-binding protein
MSRSKFLTKRPLSGYEAFRTSDLEALCHIVETRLGAKCLKAAESKSMNSSANFYALPSSELWFCDYGVPITLRFQEGEYLRIQLQFAGAGTTFVGNESCAITTDMACVSYAAATIDFQAGFQQIVWRVNRKVLSRKFAAMTGIPVSAQLEFDRILRLDAPTSLGLIALMDCILLNIANSQTHNLQLVLAELEQALIVSLLCNCDHNFRDALTQDSKTAPPRQVRLVEEYLAQNLDKPFDIEVIADTAGTSARSLYRAFRKARGYSPLDFVRQCRLVRARDLLRNGDKQLSITSIAFACGFNDASRFSKDFAAAFGEPPSAFRARYLRTPSD